MKMDCPLHSLNAGPTSRITSKMLVFQPNYFPVVLVLVCWIACPFTIVDTSLFAHSLCSLSTWYTLSFSHFNHSVPFLSGYVFVWFSLVAFLPVHQFLLFFFFSCHFLSVSFTFSLLLLLRHVMKCVHLFNSICWKGLTLSIPSESGVFKSKKIPQYVPTWFF